MIVMSAAGSGTEGEAVGDCGKTDEARVWEHKTEIAVRVKQSSSCT